MERQEVIGIIESLGWKNTNVIEGTYELFKKQNSPDLYLGKRFIENVVDPVALDFVNSNTSQEILTDYISHQ